MKKKKALKIIEDSMGDAEVFTFIKQDMIKLINKIYKDKK